MALSFAAQYNRAYRFDIVHDAWMRYFLRTGQDLFEIEVENDGPYFYMVMRNSFLKLERKERKYELVEFSPADTAPTPEEISTVKNAFEVFADHISFDKRKGKRREIIKKMLSLKVQGFTQKEIAKELGVTRETINHYNKIIMSASLLNPFSGNKLEVKKSITESTWNDRTDKDDFEEEDRNEYYALYQHKESKEGLLVRLKQPKRAHYDPDK